MHIPITYNNWWQGDQMGTSSPTAWNLRSGRLVIESKMLDPHLIFSKARTGIGPSLKAVVRS